VSEVFSTSQTAVALGIKGALLMISSPDCLKFADRLK
jgi:hypothetical protein